MKPTRYLHEKQDWNLNMMDTLPNCEEDVVQCPKGYPGHKVYWLNVKNWKHDDTGYYYEVVVKISHAHFVRNRDTGRHVGETVGSLWVHERNTVVSRRLDFAKMPEWLTEEK
jgi:hypothetical protein